jgi:hypothetical protein
VQHFGGERIGVVVADRADDAGGPRQIELHRRGAADPDASDA